MIDILIPIRPSEAHMVYPCLASLQDNTSAPFRVIILMRGGLQRDIDLVVRAFDNLELRERLILQSEDGEPLPRAIESMIDHVTAQWLVLMDVDVEVRDKGWFGKMQRPFLQDPTAGLCSAAPYSNSSTLSSIRVSGPGLVHASRILLGKGSWFLSMLDSDPDMHVSAMKAAIAQGNNTWKARGVMLRMFGNERAQVVPEEDGRDDQNGAAPWSV